MIKLERLPETELTIKHENDSINSFYRNIS